MLKDKLKTNKFLAFVYFGLKSILTVFARVFINGVDDKYKKIKGTHEGERCFIVGTGPSLSIEDLNLISNDYSFSMNSIFKLFDKTSWRPNCYAISDPNVYKSLYDDIKSIEVDVKMFAPEVAKKGASHIIFPTNNRNYYLSQCFGSKTMNLGLSKKLNKYVNNGPSVVFCLIQIAIFMGFKKIYLLGVDCNYRSSETHSKYASYNYARKISLNSGELMIKGYESIVDDLKEYNVEVINCTRGGMLEVFPRKDLEKII